MNERHGHVYAECPQCLNDGPHTRVDDSTLECGNCYTEFPDPGPEPEPI